MTRSSTASPTWRSATPALDRWSRAEWSAARRRRRKRAEENAIEVAKETEPTWVGNLYFMRVMLVGGTKVTFYTLAAMAEALHRSTVTIRSWERQGKFPTTPFKTKANGALGGKRLYTREQIEGTAAIAEEEGLLYSQRPLTPRFTQRVTQLFNHTKTEIRSK